MRSKQSMTPSVTVVSPGTAIAEIARKMRDGDVGVTLVVERERLIGVVVTDREVFTRFVGGERGACSTTVSPRLLYWSLRDVLATTGATRARRLPA